MQLLKIAHRYSDTPSVICLESLRQFSAPPFELTSLKISTSFTLKRETEPVGKSLIVALLF